MGILLPVGIWESYPSPRLLFSSPNLPEVLVAKTEAAQGCTVAGGTEVNIFLILPNIQFRLISPKRLLLKLTPHTEVFGRWE
jgi:hypothetical protein